MNITEIPFAGIRNTDPDTIHMKTYPGRSWGRLTKPLQAVKLFGAELESFTMNSYGAIRLKGSWGKDKEVPQSMDLVEDGLLLIPWGQPQILNSCGTLVDMFVANDRLVIDYKTKDKYNSEQYMYQMQFPLSEPNIVEFHYYHCVSGYNTVVGVANTVDDVVSWNVKPNQPYMKKALRIDTTPEAKPYQQPTSPNGKPFNTPFGPKPETPVGEWRTVYEGAGYRVQEGVK